MTEIHQVCYHSCLFSGILFPTSCAASCQFLRGLNRLIIIFLCKNSLSWPVFFEFALLFFSLSRKRRKCGCRVKEKLTRRVHTTPSRDGKQRVNLACGLLGAAFLPLCERWCWWGSFACCITVSRRPREEKQMVPLRSLCRHKRENDAPTLAYRWRPWIFSFSLICSFQTSPPHSLSLSRASDLREVVTLQLVRSCLFFYQSAPIPYRPKKSRSSNRHPKGSLPSLFLLCILLFGII